MICRCCYLKSGHARCFIRICLSLLLSFGTLNYVNRISSVIRLSIATCEAKELASGRPNSKTYRGLNKQFHHHVVKAGLIDQDTGGFLSKIEDNRLLADYVEDVIPEHKARETVDMAGEFVEAIESKLGMMMTDMPEEQGEQVREKTIST